MVRFAPRADAYQMLFLGTVKDAHHIDYVYEATPLSRPSGAWVDRHYDRRNAISSSRRSLS